MAIDRKALILRNKRIAKRKADNPGLRFYKPLTLNKINMFLERWGDGERTVKIIAEFMQKYECKTTQAYRYMKLAEKEFEVQTNLSRSKRVAGSILRMDTIYKKAIETNKLREAIQATEHKDKLLAQVDGIETGPKTKIEILIGLIDGRGAGAGQVMAEAIAKRVDGGFSDKTR